MFTEQERQIIDYGKANGRTLDQVKQSISNYRLGISKAPQGTQQGGLFGTGFAPGYAEGIDNIGENILKDYENAVKGIGDSVQGGATKLAQGVLDVQKGDYMDAAGNFALGAGQAGIGSAWNFLGAIFAPVAEVVKGVTPKTGIKPVDTVIQAAEGAAALYGPQAAIPGAVLAAAYEGKNFAIENLLKIPAFAEWAKANPDLIATVDHAIDLGVVLVGQKLANKNPNPKGDILNANIKDVPGRVAGNIADTVEKVARPLGQALHVPQLVQKVEQGIQEGTDLIGKGLKKAGEVIYKDAYTLTADEARITQNYKINVKFLKGEIAKAKPGSPEFKDLTSQLKTLQEHAPVVRGDTAMEKGIVGTEKMIGEQSGVAKKVLWKDQIEPALKGSKARITKKELFALAKERVNSEVEPTRRAAFQRAYDSLWEDYSKFKSTDLLNANQIKSSLDAFTPAKIFKGQNVQSEAKTLKSDMAKAIRQKTYDSLADENIKASYRDYANLKELEKVGIHGLTQEGFKGGFGGFWTSLYKATVTPIKTVGGQVLYKLGDYLQFVGKPGLKTLEQYFESGGRPDLILPPTVVSNEINSKKK